MTILIHKLSRWLAFFTTVILTLRFYTHFSFWYALPVAVLGILWTTVGSQRSLTSNAGFVCFSILIAMDVYEHGINLLLIFVMHAALVQWDLYNLQQRLGSPGYDVDPIIYRHLNRLGLVIFAGILISLLTANVQINLSFFTLFVCSLVVMVAISHIIKNLLSNTE